MTFKLYKCNNMDCNCEFILNSDASIICPYCGDNITLVGEDVDNIIDKCIPFEYDKEMAFTLINKHLKKNLFCPSSFKRKNNINNIISLYIPMYMYKFLVDGNMSFITNDYNNKKASIDDKNTLRYLVTKSIHFEFDKVLGKGISNFDDNLYKLEPWNCDGLVDISSLDNQEFVISKENILYDDNLDFMKTKCLDTSISIVKNSIKHQEKNLNSKDITIDLEKKDSILVPVFVIVMKYKGNNYTYLMNGQSGKVVGDDVVGIKESIIFVILLFIGFFVIATIIMYFGYEVF